MVTVRPSSVSSTHETSSPFGVSVRSHGACDDAGRDQRAVAVEDVALVVGVLAVVARRVGDVAEGATAREQAGLPGVAAELGGRGGCSVGGCGWRRRRSRRSRRRSAGAPWRGTAARSATGWPMRSPSSWVSRTRFASSSSAPFIHGGTAGRRSTSISIGTGSPWPGKAPLICASTELAVASPCEAHSQEPVRLDQLERQRPGAEDAGCPVGADGSWIGPGREDVEHPAVGEGDVDLDLVGVPLVGDGLDADAGQTERRRRRPRSRRSPTRASRVVRLRGEDVLELVAQPAREIDRHVPFAPFRRPVLLLICVILPPWRRSWTRSTSSRTTRWGRIPTRTSSTCVRSAR